MLITKFEKESFQLIGADNMPIAGDITYANAYPDYIVIFVHGFKGFKDWGTHEVMANYFAANGIYFLKFNFSHSGVKPEDLSDIKDLQLFSKNTPSKELSDLTTVIDFTVKKFPHLQIALLGHSRGGGVSLLQASTDPRVVKLITWAGIGSFRSLWPQAEEAEWREKGIRYILNGRTKEQMPLSVDLLDDVLDNAEDLDLDKAAASIKMPWLMAHGTADDAVDVSVAKNFKDKDPDAELLIIDGANHVFGARHPYDSDQLPEQLEKFCNVATAFVNKPF